VKILGPLRMGLGVLCPGADLNAPCALYVVEIASEPWAVLLSGEHMIIDTKPPLATCACGREFDYVREGQATWFHEPPPATGERMAEPGLFVPRAAESWCKP